MITTMIKSNIKLTEVKLKTIFVLNEVLLPQCQMQFNLDIKNEPDHVF